VTGLKRLNVHKINANTFLETWQAFSEYFTMTNTDWLQLYNNNTNWSERFLGGKSNVKQE